MSTAGKVLAVLVVLTSALAMVMASGVAVLNMSGGEQIKGLQNQVVKLEKDVAETERNIIAIKDQISVGQAAITDQLAVMRSHRADLEKHRSETIEIATRVKYQLEGVQESVRQAEATRELRAAEKAREIQAKADAEAEVEDLKQEYAALVEQLDKLRDEFKATIDSNRKIVARLKSARSS